jgi:type II secretory pathway pseudopilin PulG
MELIVVLAIIAIMAGVLLPALASYLRLYRIRGAMQQVAADISATRMRAISKNANLGVTFVVLNSSQYRTVVEDDLDPANAPQWRTIAAEDWPTVLGMPAQAGQVQLLPAGIQFDNPALCPAPPGGVVAGAGVDWGIRFTRLGAACGVVTGATCGGLPQNPPAYTKYINTTGSLFTACLWQPATNLRRWVNVSVGGRVSTQP